MSEDAHDVMEGLSMSGDEQRDEIRSAMGFAHLDGEIEYSYRCPKCESSKTSVAGSTESNVLSCTCYNCGYSWRQEAQYRLTRWTQNGGIEVLIDGKWVPAFAETLQSSQHAGLDEAIADAASYARNREMPPVVKDRTKARFDLIPYGPLWKMAEVMTNGANKPGRVAHNWRKGTEWSDYFAAMMRHAALWQQGEDFEIDPGTGVRIDHLAAVMCCASILLEYQMFQLGTDDRFPAGHPAYKGEKKDAKG